MEAYFGFEPDEEAIRALIAAASDEETARSATFGLTEKRDWVANSLAGLKPVGQGAFSFMARHDRARVGANDIAVEIEAGLAFGTGHHGTTRGCLLHFDRLLKRRRPRACSRRRLRRGRARHRRRQSPAPQGLARRHRSGRGRSRQRQRAAERRRRALPGGRLARGRERAPCARARLTISCSPTSWRGPCGCSRRRSRRSSARRRRGDRLRPASCRCSGRACVLAGAGVSLWPSGSTSKAGRASDCGGEIVRPAI